MKARAGWRACFLSSKYTLVPMVSGPLRHGGWPPFTLQMSQELLSPKEAPGEKAPVSKAPSGTACSGSSLLSSSPASCSPFSPPPSSSPARPLPALRAGGKHPAVQLPVNVSRGNTQEQEAGRKPCTPAVTLLPLHAQPPTGSLLEERTDSGLWQGILEPSSLNTAEREERRDRRWQGLAGGLRAESRQPLR